MDLHKRILTQLYATLTDDSTLQSAMGGSVNLHLTWATPDATFPYLVHKLDLVNITDWSPERRGDYLIDIWSDSPNADEILAIRDQIMTLVHNLYYSAVSEHDGLWFWRQSDMFVPEPEAGIWHYNITFNMKVLVLADIASRLRR